MCGDGLFISHVPVRREFLPSSRYAAREEKKISRKNAQKAQKDSREGHALRNTSVCSSEFLRLLSLFAAILIFLANTSAGPPETGAALSRPDRVQRSNDNLTIISRTFTLCVKEMFHDDDRNAAFAAQGFAAERRAMPSVRGGWVPGRAGFLREGANRR